MAPTLRSRTVGWRQVRMRRSPPGLSRRRTVTRLRSGCIQSKSRWSLPLDVACVGGSTCPTAVTGTGGGTVEECAESARTLTPVFFVVGGTPPTAVGAPLAVRRPGARLVQARATTALVDATALPTVAATTVIPVATTPTWVNIPVHGVGIVRAVDITPTRD